MGQVRHAELRGFQRHTSRELLDPVCVDIPWRRSCPQHQDLAVVMSYDQETPWWPQLQKGFCTLGIQLWNLPHPTCSLQSKAWLWGPKDP